MSFLNPVNEPVLRFKSTDAGAPQINYNARVAGDIKAVLKACLVTGYGSTASAGWSVANEVNHVAEFVSPSATMSDYRLGVDDSTATKTDWHYNYQGVKTVPAGSDLTKNFTYCDKTHASNGWQFLVTDRGFIFIELVYQPAFSKLSARLTYFSQVKSALIANSGINMMFFSVGHDARASRSSYLYSMTFSYLALESYDTGQIYGLHTDSLGATSRELGISAVDITSPLYITDKIKRVYLGQIPGLMGVSVSSADSIFGVSDSQLDGRPILKLSGHAGTLVNATAYCSVFMIRLDTWGY